MDITIPLHCPYCDKDMEYETLDLMTTDDPVTGDPQDGWGGAACSECHRHYFIVSYWAWMDKPDHPEPPPEAFGDQLPYNRRGLGSGSGYEWLINRDESHMRRNNETK